jgi:hypothetical protein
MGEFSHSIDSEPVNTFHLACHLTFGDGHLRDI